MCFVWISEQCLFPYTTLTDWFVQPRRSKNRYGQYNVSRYRLTEMQLTTALGRTDGDPIDSRPTVRCVPTFICTNPSLLLKLLNLLKEKS